MIAYQPYPNPNRALTKSLYRALRDGNINRQTFALGLRFVMGAHREVAGEQCAWCEVTEPLVQCNDALHRCATHAYEQDFCKACGRPPIGGGGDYWEPDSFSGLCSDCRREAWNGYLDDCAIDAYYHGGQG